jgi:hypothetical protein
MFQPIKSSILFVATFVLFALTACGGGGSSSSGGDSGTQVTLEQIVISPFIDTVAKDGEIDFYATGIYSDQSSVDLTSQVSWTVDNNALASIDSSGHVVTLQAGVVTITSSLDGIQAQHSLTITDITLDAIQITPQQAEIPSGLSQEFQALGSYSDGTTQDLSDYVSWASSAPLVASMTDATATGANQGTTTISATYNGVSAQASLTVNSAVLQSLEVEVAEPDLQIATSSAISAVGLYSDNTSRDVSTEVTWQVDDALVIELDETGLTVEGLAVGSANLIAGLDGIQAQAGVSVSDAVLTRIEVSPVDSTIPAGLTGQLTATGIFSNQTIQDLTTQVTWLSSADSIASVDNRSGSKGEVAALTQGSATISAHYQGQSGSAAITVSQATLVSIEVSPADSTLANGHQQQFTALASYSDGSSVDVTDSVSWSSSNQNASLVSGQQAGLYQANAVGSVLVVASLNGIQGFTNLEVTNATLSSLSIVSETTSQALGMTQQLTANATYSDATTRDVSDQVIWSSSDTGVAQVSNNSANKGEVTTVSTGNVEISADLDGVQASLSLAVTAATLSEIQLTSDSASFYINQTRQASALGIYSDATQQDLTNQVQWLSSDDAIVAASNGEGTQGLLSALGAGQVEITAVLNGINSDTLSFNVIDDPNYPGSVSVTASPNVILNDGSDETTLLATIQPLQDSGVIADGTAVNFIVVDNGVTQTIPATTVNGEASTTLTSTNLGFISVTAEVVGSGLDATTSILVSDSFTQVLLVAPASNATLINGDTTYQAGSVFLVYMRNLSNRDFNIAAFIAQNGGVDLPNTPVTNPAFLSDGVLEGGEYTGAGYQLDVDTVDNTISLGYLLSDTPSGEGFGFLVNF